MYNPSIIHNPFIVELIYFFLHGFIVPTYYWSNPFLLISSKSRWVCATHSIDHSGNKPSLIRGGSTTKVKW